MLLILPPSETKRDGGAEGTSLEVEALSFPSLTKTRRTALAALRKLSRNLAASTAALGLGPNGRAEIERNRAVTSSPVMPALERYTGVLYDALDASTLTPEARRRAGEHVVVASALFGLLGADDRIPAYRLSHDSKLPEIRIAQLWKQPVADVLAATPGLMLDLRSESYVKLGPAPQRDDAFYVRVVSVGDDGRKRALNHFNKKGKGEFVRALLESGAVTDDVEQLIAWAATAGIELRIVESGVLELTV